MANKVLPKPFPTKKNTEYRLPSSEKVKRRRMRHICLRMKCVREGGGKGVSGEEGDARKDE